VDEVASSDSRSFRKAKRIMESSFPDDGDFGVTRAFFTGEDEALFGGESVSERIVPAGVGPVGGFRAGSEEEEISSSSDSEVKALSKSLEFWVQNSI
jgi:hypothetical protein